MHFPYSAPPMHSHNVLVSTGSYPSLIRAGVATLRNTPHAHHRLSDLTLTKHIKICLTLLFASQGSLFLAGGVHFGCLSFKNQVLVQASDFEKRGKNAHHPPKSRKTSIFINLLWINCTWEFVEMAGRCTPVVCLVCIAGCAFLGARFSQLSQLVDNSSCNSRFKQQFLPIWGIIWSLLLFERRELISESTLFVD